MKKIIIILLLACFVLMSAVFAYTGNIYEYLYKDIEVTLNSEHGQVVEGYLYSIEKIIEEIYVDDYQKNEKPFKKNTAIRGERTVVKYYLVMRNGRDEYKIDSKDILFIKIKKY